MNEKETFEIRPATGVFDPLLLHTADRPKPGVIGRALKSEPKMLPRPTASISKNVSILHLFMRPKAFDTAIVCSTIIRGRTPMPEPNPLIIALMEIVSFALILTDFTGN